VTAGRVARRGLDPAFEFLAIDREGAPVQTSLLSNMIMSAPPVANFATSAPAALPSGLPKPALTAARSSKCSVAIRWKPDGPAGVARGPLLISYFR
jgi:hypothetical protein